MLFRESFITDKGAEILARAAAGDGPIIWTRAATSNANTDSDSLAEMNRMTDITKTAADSYTSSGVVTNAVVNDARTSVSIYAELTNEEYDGEARTFGAWAKIDGDENDVLAIVARCGGATPTTINPASEGVVKAFVDFTLQISAEQAQAVAVGEEYYATAAALEDEQDAREALAGRVVTTHRAGDETAGDAQTILGEKTFNQRVTIAQSGDVFAYGNVMMKGISAIGLDADTGVVAWNETNGRYVEVLKVNATESDAKNAISIRNVKYFSVGKVSAGNVETGLIVGIDGEDMQEGMKLLTVNADEITFNSGVTFLLNEAAIYESDGNIELQPATGKSVDIKGKLSVEDGLIGLAPYVNNTTFKVKIGSIVMMYAISTEITNMIGPGDSITIPANTFFGVRWSAEHQRYEPDGMYIEAGTYVAITGFAPYSTSAGPMLIQRVA